MKISKAARRIQPSLTRRLFDMAKEYDNVIDFTLGDPDYKTPKKIIESAKRAMDEGKTKYSANAGLPELRSIISDCIYNENKVKYDPQSEIIVTVGAMEALYLTLFCMLDPGDQVIIPAPYWINYVHMVQMCGGVPIIIDSYESNNFIVDINDIKNAITEKTTAIILNSPNNPTGTVYDKNTVLELCETAKKNDIMIVWDECYKSILYDDTEFVSVLDAPDVKSHAVIINSCSKKFSMTGWRIGYAAAPSELVSNMTKIQENLVACAPLPSQYAAIEAFRGDIDTKYMLDGFTKRRNKLVEGINGINKLSCKYPKGTFYAFVNIKRTGLGSEKFAYRLLESQQVAVVPGITYGDCCEGFIRIAYTVDEDKIEEGIRRIRRFIQEL